MATYAPARLLTASEFMRMVEADFFGPEEHLELVEGQVLVVTPQGPPHSNVTGRLGIHLARVLDPALEYRQHSPILVGELDLPEPDLAVLRPGDYRGRHARADECLLIVEVSQTSQRHDRAKAARYAAGGCPRYWILDLAAGALVEFSGLRKGRYESERILGPDDRVEVPDLVERAEPLLLAVSEILALG